MGAVREDNRCHRDMMDLRVAIQGCRTAARVGRFCAAMNVKPAIAVHRVVLRRAETLQIIFPNGGFSFFGGGERVFALDAGSA
jgi:hypothetical protein